MAQGPQSFSGVYAASLTPMHTDLRCNDEALASHCNDLLHRGCSGVLLFGTTGEGTSFSVDERIATLKNVVKQGVDPQKLIPVIACCAIDDAIRLATAARDARCSAILIAPPFFYKKVSDAGVIAFYRSVIHKIDAPDLKVFLYHIPQYSGVSITVNIIHALRREFPHTVIGIKDSEKNFSFTQDILLQCPGFRVFVGSDAHLSDAVRLGAAGGMTSLANAYPERICSLYAFGKDSQLPDNNAAVQRILQTIQDYPLLPAIKSLVESQKGAVWHVMRPPLMPLDEQEQRALYAALAQ